MGTAVVFALLGVGALLVPDLRDDPATWAFSGLMIALAVLRLTLGSTGRSIRTARQVKYNRWWGYTSHDGTGAVDAREKRGDQ
jgi:hypothetical protein